MLISEIEARVATLLNDAGYTRWTEPELLNWFNDGQAEIVKLRPDANILTLTAPLVGGTHQSIPARGVVLSNVFANMGIDGLTPGAKISEIQRADLDAFVPDWRTTTPVASVEHFMRERDKPKDFWVYPPQPDTDPAQVNLAYSAIPDVQLANDEDMYLPPEYIAPVVDYMTYRAFSKDAEGANVQRATAHYQVFLQAIGLTEVSNAAAGAA